VKRFLIAYTYRLDKGSEETWHRHIAAFITALDGDPELKGRIAYRCMKARDGAEYYHWAEAADDGAIRALQTRDFFKRYTEETKRVAGGSLNISSLETIAETPPMERQSGGADGGRPAPRGTCPDSMPPPWPQHALNAAK
jgi:hypothetical protein